MGKIYRRPGSSCWYIRIGSQRYSTHTTSKTHAEDILHRKELELWQRRHNIVDNTDCRLEDFFRRYLEWVETNRRPETLKSYKSIIKMFSEFLKNAYPSVKKLKDVSPIILEEYKTYRKKYVKGWTLNNDIKEL